MLGTQVQEVIRKKVGSKIFFAAFNNARKKVEYIRQDRKRKTAEQALVNPAMAARRKIKRNLNKRESRKRQMHANKDRVPRKRPAIEVQSS